MELISTSGDPKTYSLTDAIMLGLAPDGGLFMPTSLDPLPGPFFHSISEYSFQELALQIARQILGAEVTNLAQVITDSLTFEAPIIPLTEQISILELFHGPSLAFKDFGAQFMSRLLSSLLDNDQTDLTILVATSGDTGGAVAAGFYQVPNIRVVILYPKNGVSQLQEHQLTTYGDNIHALEVEGTFDDCQSLVKEAFSNVTLRQNISLTSANSINIGRLIPQSFYYFEAYRQLPIKNQKISFSVPSGNFGNLTAGLLAKHLGLPIHSFIAATNINDIVPIYLNTGIFEPRPSIATLSNAMDVGNPSNFFRMIYLFDRSTWNVSQSDLFGYSFTDQETIDMIKVAYQRYKYLLDPHGAVSLLGSFAFLNEHCDHHIISLETAHPTKFLETVRKATSTSIDLHPSLAQLLHREQKKTTITSDLEALADFLYQL